MSWPHLLCLFSGALALWSQHWWDRKRTEARERGRDYTHFDFPVAVTLISLAVPGGLELLFTDVKYLWWCWGAGALAVAIPSVVWRFNRNRAR